MVLCFARLHPPPESVRLKDIDAQLDGVIAIHSTALGPAAGGCRLWKYADSSAAVDDACRLAEGMSYKNALAELPFGGAKAVLRMPEAPFDRERLFKAFGKAVRELGGIYLTAEDVGTTVGDMRHVATVTSHVAGLDRVQGRAGGDPSLWPARGVFDALRTAAKATLGAEVRDLTIAVQGTGNVGAGLCRLLSDAGAKLIIADIDPIRRDRLGAIHNARIVSTEEILSVDADVLAPCALGGTINADSVTSMKAKLICGGANNQLAGADVADMLVDRGIAYVPNAGGIISVTAEYLREEAGLIQGRVARIGPRVAAIMEAARRGRRSPLSVADGMAEAIIANAERKAA